MSTNTSTGSQTANHSANLQIGPDDNISAGKALLLGLQHVLAMDIYVVPFIIAGALSAAPADATALIQATFLAAGIASVIQLLFFLKLPVCQGPSYVPIGAILGIYFATGSWAAVFGASLVGSVVLLALGYSGLYKAIVKHLIPPVVSGTIIMIVGLTLLPAALTGNVFINYNGLSYGQNISVAIATLAILVALTSLARRVAWGALLQISSVIMALVLGTLLVWALGGYSLDLGNTSFFALPKTILDYGVSFDLASIVTMVIIYLVLLAETTGTWYAVASVTDLKLSDKQLSAGVVGEGLGCLAAALVGSTPVTGYSTNAGLISLTGVAAKKVFLFASLIFIGLGFFGQLAGLINSIPAPVIGGVFALVCMIIALNGLRVVRKEEFSERTIYIMGVPLIFAIGLNFLP